MCQYVDLRDSPHSPGVHSFPGIVALNPPGLCFVPDQPLDSQGSLAGEPEDRDLTGMVSSAAHQKDIAGTKSRFHRTAPDPDQAPRAQELGEFRVTGAAAAFAAHRE